MITNHQPILLGIDVGTTSARAAVFTLDGRLLNFAERAIVVFREGTDFAEHSSKDVWKAVGVAAQEALTRARVDGQDVVGVGFDATCSLVLLGPGDEPLSATPGQDAARNVIVWMDHRATAEAEAINATGHAALRRVGGVISPEMEPPKLLWLKHHHPETWSRLRQAFDLGDWLAYRATGNPARSLCTTVCKWLHDGHAWDEGFYGAIGLADLIERGAQGPRVVPLGTDLGPVTAEAAEHLGISTKAHVAAAMIDAHAGGLAVTGMTPDGQTRPESVLALILGTSSCFMATSREPLFVPGVWGPYLGAMIPGYSLGEGGQSWSGAAIDHVIKSHPAHAALVTELKNTGRSAYDELNSRLSAAERAGQLQLARDIHVLPDLIGNRSPLADPHVRGMIDGFDGDATRDGLARLYLAAVEGVAHGARHVVETLGKHGFHIEALHACGGGTKNPRLLQVHADVLGLPLHLPECPEAMPLGSALCAAVAAGAHPDFPAAMAAMCRAGKTIHPRPTEREYHDRKHQVFLDLYATQARHRRIMRGEPV